MSGSGLDRKLANVVNRPTDRFFPELVRPPGIKARISPCSGAFAATWGFAAMPYVIVDG